MAEEDPPSEVTVVPKFDMPYHVSAMSHKDVKSLAKQYDIPLDLHLCASTEGWTMDKLLKEGHWFSFEKDVGKGTGGKIFQETFFGMKGWKDMFFFLDRRAIPDAMAWRHHDSNVNDALPNDGFSILDVHALAKKFIDLRLVPANLLFKAGIASTWDFLGFYPISKDTEINVHTFPFSLWCFYYSRYCISCKKTIDQHITPHLEGHPILDKTEFQKEVEVEDHKVLAAKERKAPAAAKKKAHKKRDRNEGECS
uniref:Uncharacterized protein n=1 Tax=Tanacetum cinerariifolium TaxID=118510 RepID=A0A6L2LIX7_TANCI|nr:hypothetical protein [Tanacetum cinerariifolium]